MQNNRQTWLNKRKGGIGGSDAAAVIGRNPWLSNVDLWEIKTGRKQQADVSDKEAVKYGIAAESFLIDLFKLDYPRYEVKHIDFDLLRDKSHPFLIASLDGRLIERETGKKGVLEIKTTEIRRSTDWDKWDNQVPDNYYCQVIHYLSVTGWDFAVLKAQIKHYKDEEPTLTTRHYYFDRKKCEEDIEYLRAKEIEFWQEYVEKDVCPPLILPTI